MTKKNYVIGIYLGCMLLASGCGQGEELSSQSGGNTVVSDGLMQGQVAPDFTLQDLNGQKLTLSSFRNKSSVCLVFWATWCPYCIKEIPRIKQLYKKYSGRGLEIVSIDIAVNDPQARVREFQKKMQLNYPVLYDESNRVSRLYNISGVPVSIIIDREGRIRYRGFQLPDNIEQLLSQLL